MHPILFSYLDVRLASGAIDATVVVHADDLAHDLGATSPEQIVDAAYLAAHADAATALLRPRLTLTADGHRIDTCQWSLPAAIADSQSVRWTIHCPAGGDSGRLSVAGPLFTYNPQHQTFVNVYDRDQLRAQFVLSAERPAVDYFAGTVAGTREVIRTFVPAGVHHILIGPDHICFLIGLLLLGGSFRKLLLVVTAFTVAHSITLSLAATNVVTPPDRWVEPAIALSIIYVGADNLLRKSGRDTRALIAFAFGLIHGFGFASVLREMGLPGSALGWSLFSFNVGVEIGQLLVVAVVAGALAWLRGRSERVGRRIAFAGSVLVLLAGTYWFVQRLYSAIA